jgi:hypothetical protein
MVFIALLIVAIVAILMEDSASIKKSEEEKREDERLAEAVNRTLAKEAKEREMEEERKKKEEAKKRKKEVAEKTVQADGTEEHQVVGKEVKQEEACSSANFTCPIVEPCPEVRECPPQKECEECQECKDCNDKECGPCPEVEPCKKCPKLECKPCVPCSVGNHTTDNSLDSPSLPTCPVPDSPSMSVPVAMLVGACASLLVTGVANAWLSSSLFGTFLVSTLQRPES